MPQLVYLPDVTTLVLDEARCNGCQMCLIVCPHDVFTLENKRARIARRDACMECGACALNCPEDAIAVKRGVGCAVAVLNGMRSGGEPSCGCGEENDTSGCCC